MSAGDITLDHVTISGNQAMRGGGVHLSAGLLTIGNSIVAGNSSTAGESNLGVADGTVAAVGPNLLEGDPMLAPLGSYGGPDSSADGFHTMLPLPGSPALDAAAAATHETDQRGLPRTAGKKPDLGAAESRIAIVDTVADENDGAGTGGTSLRDALASPPPNDFILFDLSLSGGTIRLEHGELSIDSTLTVDASTLPAGLTIDGDGKSRIFQIAAGGDAVLEGLALVNGYPGLIANGGGILNSGNLELRRCLIGGCDAWAGGGIFNSGSIRVENSTIHGNVAGVGGAFASDSRSRNYLRHATITRNLGSHVAGVELFGLSYLENCIVAGNGSTSGSPQSSNIRGYYLETGPNLTSGDPRLAPLADYGGPTRTMLPLPGSRAIEAGVSDGDLGADSLDVFPGTLVNDQRGAPRVTGAVPDLGAAEAIPLHQFDFVDADGDGVFDFLEGPASPYPHLLPGIDDSALDSDGDGITDSEEILSMTDPLDPTSRLRVLSIVAEGPPRAGVRNFRITYTSFPGIRYVAASSFDLDFSSHSFVWPARLASGYVQADVYPLVHPAEFIVIRALTD